MIFAHFFATLFAQKYAPHCCELKSSARLLFNNPFPFVTSSALNLCQTYANYFCQPGDGQGFQVNFYKLFLCFNS
jgi:hypothetical protein